MKYLITFLRFIKGYVVFKAEKGFIERFLNLCTQNRIHLWNITVEDNILTACIGTHNFKKLRPVAKKSGVKIRITNKNGFIFEYKRYNKRIGIAIGLFFFILFHLFMNQFVWCIDVSGNSTISKEEIIRCAQEQGLSAGTFKPYFNEVKAARNIASSYNGKVPWLSINIKGSMAVIELRENNNIIRNIEDNIPCNIVADFNGIILSMESLRGDAMVTVGNGVKKGDMLISGVIINEDLSTTYYKAKGKITALHNKSSEISEEINHLCRKASISNTFCTSEVFGMNIPLGRYSEEKNTLKLEDKRSLFLNGFSLPFYIEKNTIIELREEDTSYKNKYIYHTEKIGYQIYSKNKNSLVISSEESISSSAEYLTFIGEYTLIDFIGKEKQILSDNLK